MTMHNIPGLARDGWLFEDDADARGPSSTSSPRSAGQTSTPASGPCPLCLRWTNTTPQT